MSDLNFGEGWIGLLKDLSLTVMSSLKLSRGATRSSIRWPPREGVIIDCPLNGQFHDRRDMIITSQMAVSNNFITVTVNKISEIRH